MGKQWKVWKAYNCACVLVRVSSYFRALLQLKHAEILYCRNVIWCDTWQERKWKCVRSLVMPLRIRGIYTYILNNKQSYAYTVLFDIVVLQMIYCMLWIFLITLAKNFSKLVLKWYIGGSLACVFLSVQFDACLCVNNSLLL